MDVLRHILGWLIVSIQTNKYINNMRPIAGRLEGTFSLTIVSSLVVPVSSVWDEEKWHNYPQGYLKYIEEPKLK